MWARHGERRRPKRPAGDPVVPTDEATSETAADAERIDQLIHGVRDLRTLLAVDLSFAAGAADQGAADVVAEIVEADRAAVADLVARAQRLATGDRALEPGADNDDGDPTTATTDDADPREIRTRRLSRLLPAAPVAIAAAVVVAVFTGTIPVPSSNPTNVHSQPVAASWHRFTEAAGSDNAERVLAAAEQLHRSLVAFIDSAGNDPAKAREVMRLLQLEQQLLLRERPPGMDVILAQSRQLIAALQTTLDAAGLPDATSETMAPTTSSARPAKRVKVPAVKPPSARADRHSTSTSPPRNPAPAPKPSPSATPSASPSPSPSNPIAPLPSPPSHLGH